MGTGFWVFLCVLVIAAYLATPASNRALEGKKNVVDTLPVLMMVSRLDYTDSSVYRQVLPHRVQWRFSDGTEADFFETGNIHVVQGYILSSYQAFFDYNKKPLNPNIMVWQVKIWPYKQQP